MAKLTGGQAAIKSLQAENVEHVFGLIGSATMEMFDALYDAPLSMQTRAEMDAFLADLCTPAELRAFAERWQVARLLDAGGKSYREIAAEAHLKAEDRTIKQCQNRGVAHGPEERAHAQPGRVLGVHCRSSMGRFADLQDALAQYQAAGVAELYTQFRVVLRDAAGGLAVLRRYF